jgi:hypothetical protein
MPKKSSIAISIVMLWAASLACGQSVNVPTLDPNAASTAIAETINALNALASPTQSPAPSFTPEASTATPDSSLTPEGSIVLPTLPAVYVTVSVDTFCRLGPGKEYEKAGILLVGEVTEVIGRDAFNLFWYVRNPDLGAGFCWISAEYATVEGDVLSLVAQPPSANLVSEVEVIYLGMGKCSNAWWSDLQIRNNSTVTFKSISLVIGDGVTHITRSMMLSTFPFTNRCNTPTSVDTLGPGSSVKISSPEFTYDLTGAEISVSITLCSDAEMRGTCVSKNLAYTP